MINYKFVLDYALLHLNYNCNLNCSHCRVPIKDKNKKSMSFQQAIGIIDQLAALKVSTITFTGGEPTIYKDTLKLIEYSVLKGIKVRLQTNFAIVSSVFLDDFYIAGGRFISLSLDGLENNHDIIRGLKGLFSKILALITEYRNKISFQVDFVLSWGNYSDIYELIHLLRSKGVKIFSFRIMVPVSGAKVQDDYAFTKEDLYKVYSEIYRNTLSLKDIKIISPDPLFNLIKYSKSNSNLDSSVTYLSGCSIGLGILSIQPNSDVLLCSFINNSVGNLQKERLASIINRINRMKIIKYQVNRHGIKECSMCEYKFMCGGCRARALEMLGDFYEKDPLCFKDYLNIEKY